MEVSTIIESIDKQKIVKLSCLGEIEIFSNIPRENNRTTVIRNMTMGMSSLSRYRIIMNLMYI